jgi:hypothetical protein
MDRGGRPGCGRRNTGRRVLWRGSTAGLAVGDTRPSDRGWTRSGGARTSQRRSNSSAGSGSAGFVQLRPLRQRGDLAAPRTAPVRARVARRAAPQARAGPRERRPPPHQRAASTPRQRGRPPRARLAGRDSTETCTRFGQDPTRRSRLRSSAGTRQAPDRRRPSLGDAQRSEATPGGERGQPRERRRATDTRSVERRVLPRRSPGRSGARAIPRSPSAYTGIPARFSEALPERRPHGRRPYRRPSRLDGRTNGSPASGHSKSGHAPALKTVEVRRPTATCPSSDSPSRRTGWWRSRSRLRLRAGTQPQRPRRPLRCCAEAGSAPERWPPWSEIP